MQNKSNQVTKRKFLWFNNHTTILYLPMATNIIPSKWSQTVSLIWRHHAKTITYPTVQRNCWQPTGDRAVGEEKGEQVGLKRKGRLYTCRTSQGRGGGVGICAGSLWNQTPVHATWGWGPWYNYIETNNPVTLSIPRETETKTKKQRSRGEKGWWQRDRNQGISVLQTGKWDSKEWVSEQKTQFMALGMKL